MTVIAGEEFTITVPFTGNPTPKPVWIMNGEEIYPSNRIKFETFSDKPVFTNKSAVRATDTGTYQINLINSVGSDTASCRVLVVGKISYFLHFTVSIVEEKKVFYLYRNLSR